MGWGKGSKTFTTFSASKRGANNEKDWEKNSHSKGRQKGKRERGQSYQFIDFSVSHCLGRIKTSAGPSVGEGPNHEVSGREKRRKNQGREGEDIDSRKKKKRQRCRKNWRGRTVSNHYGLPHLVVHKRNLIDPKKGTNCLHRKGE